MSTMISETPSLTPENPVIQWLLDSDSSIRWQVMHDLIDAPASTVAAERSRVASDGWGAQFLDQQRPDGNWGDGIATQHWRSNLFTLLHLRYLGVEPTNERVREAIGLVRDNIDWGPEWGNSPFFEGEVEPCINGNVLALGAYFGEPSSRLMERLLSEQLADGGWNCDAERGSVRSSFHTTICVLEGLLAYEQSQGALPAITRARVCAHEYLLERRLFRKLSTGAVINDAWTRFTFPTMWQYDVLRGLDYLRSAGVAPDSRVSEAIGLVVGRRMPDGRWLLDSSPRDAFTADLEGGAGQPSRWNTLRALRVLAWHAHAQVAPGASQ